MAVDHFKLVNGGGPHDDTCIFCETDKDLVTWCIPDTNNGGYEPVGVSCIQCLGRLAAAWTGTWEKI